MKQKYLPEATEFAVFAIENTADRLKVSGDVVYKALSESDGIRTFLFPSFPALHTQGKEYIVDEVISYLNSHNCVIIP